MSNRYVDVTITNQTQAVSQAGFGLPLILDTSADFAYKEYNDLTELAVDFSSGTPVHDIASAMFNQEPQPSKVAVHGTSYTSGTDAASDLSAALDTLTIDHDDWYFLVSVEQNDEEIQELADWTDANDKLYGASTSNQTPSLSNKRAFVLVHPNAASEYPAEAWIGRCAALEPGSITWQFKTLNGVTNSGYTGGEVNSIHSANLNTYIKEGGVLITSNAVTGDGTYIDIIRGQDFLKARMAENVFQLLASTNKIPYTNGGIAQVVDRVEETLQLGASMGIIATDEDGQPVYSVEAPNASEVSVTDKSNRLLPNVNWTATIAGAVHDVDINGTLSV